MLIALSKLTPVLFPRPQVKPIINISDRLKHRERAHDEIEAQIEKTG